MPESFGTLTFAGCHFPITQASFQCVGDGDYDPEIDEDPPQWNFEVRAAPPIDPPADESLAGLLERGMRFYTESDPIPLADADDLTGVELYLKEPYDPDSGDVYFTMYLWEHNDVSELTMRFVDRKGSSYRMQVSALVHSVFEKPTRFEIDTWIEKLPSN